MKVLSVEDSTEIIESVAQTIELRWPEASLLSTTFGQTGVELAQKEHPDVVILDLGLPDIDGFQVLRQIRRFSDVPVVILTVRGEEMDKIRGLELGADDYMVKPFSPGEFLARVKAVIRRKQMPPAATEPAQKPFIRGALRIDFRSREISIGNKLMKVSPREYDLLSELVTNEGKVLSKQRLLEKIWGPDRREDFSFLEAYINRLKEMLQKEPGHPMMILNEDEGYKLTG
ncbi:MAG: response regulator transcription factor [Chloroflexota bacterium]